MSEKAISFLQRLSNDAFQNISISSHKVDTTGWTNRDGIRLGLAPVLDDTTPKAAVVVVEVGAWKGGSARVIAEALKEAPPLAHAQKFVVSVDTWLGGPDFWTSWTIDAPDRGQALDRVHGFPSVFYTFVRNLKATGHADVSAPLPISSRCVPAGGDRH